MRTLNILKSSVLAALCGFAVPLACAEEKVDTAGSAGGAGGQGGQGGETAQAGASSGAGGEAPAPVIVPGGTGAFGVVVVGGVQKMYLPLGAPSTSGNGIIAVVDVGLKGNGVRGASALITDIELPADTDAGFYGPYATTTNGTSDVVIAASTQYPDIWFIDPKSDRVTKHITLDATAGVSSFSGGGGYVTGIAMDPAHGRAILSVWNGFAIVDLATKEIVKTIEAPPAENFGFDASRGLILDPFYECSGSYSADGGLTFCNDYKNSKGEIVSDGLVVINLADDTVYTYDDPTASNYSFSSVNRSTSSPVGSEPDSAAADPGLGLAVVPSEGGGFQNIIDIGHAKYDARKGFVTARDYVLPSFGLTGVAIEPQRHLVLLEGEGSSSVAALDLNELGRRATEDARAAASAGAGGEGGASADAGVPETDPNQIDAALVRGVFADMPALPNGGYWSNIGDPHGVAVTTGIADGRSVGFLVNSQREWVARIDLDAFLALGTGADASSSNYLSDIASAVTFLDGRTKNGEGGAGGGGGAGN